MIVVLQDPQSGSLVHFRTAQLPQKCQLCGLELEGQTIVNVVDSGRGWVCFEHTERLLMSSPMSPQFRDRNTARDALKNVVPGDQIVVSRPLLSALGME